jgi:ABC-type maltose transport system permease subunit
MLNNCLMKPRVTEAFPAALPLIILFLLFQNSFINEIALGSEKYAIYI